MFIRGLSEDVLHRSACDTIVTTGTIVTIDTIVPTGTIVTIVTIGTPPKGGVIV